MSAIEITPALLAELQKKTESMRPGDRLHINPAVVLAMIAEIEQLWRMELRWHKLLADAKPGPEVLGSGFDLKKN